MNRLLLSLLFVLFATSVSAQVCEGLNVITFRVGDNGVSSPDAGTPTLSLSYEYEIIEDAFGIQTLCLGAGAHIGYRYYRRSLASTMFYHAYSNIIYSLRTTAHYDILGQFFGMHSDHIDTYATVSLGIEHTYRSYHNATTGNIVYLKDGSEYYPSGWRYKVWPGVQVGCRYWFTPNLGVVAEVGFDGFTYFDAGFSVCF